MVDGSDEFPDKEVVGEKVRGDINPSKDYDDAIMKEHDKFRDNLYEGLDQMLNEDRSPVWQIIREGRNDELLRCVGILDRVISNMEKSSYLVRNLGDSSEFTERFSLPSTFKDNVNDLRRQIQEGETQAALMRVKDIVDVFKRYRRVSVTAVTNATSEVSKFFYMMDELRVVQSIIRDVRFTLQEDNALMLSDSDYVGVADVTYKLLLKKILEKNDDVEIPVDPDDLDSDVEEFMSGLKRRGTSYKNIGWEKRQKMLIEEYFSDEFAKDDRSKLTDEEIDEMKRKFGSEPVESWFGDTIE